MRTYLSILAAVTACLAAGPMQGYAQQTQPVYGMFGQRVLGAPINPRGSTFSRGAIVRGVAGDFFGTGADYAGSVFPGQPWQYTPPAVPTYLPIGPFAPLPPYVEQPTLEPQPIHGATRPEEFVPPEPVMPPAPPEAVPEVAPPAPMQWLRGPAGAGVQPAAPEGAPAQGSASAPTPTPGPIAMQVGFRPPETGSAAASEVARLIGRLSQINKVTPITVTMRGETAVLRGAVATEHDRALAENIARLEPGIWDVHNELTVTGRR